LNLACPTKKKTLDACGAETHLRLIVRLKGVVNDFVSKIESLIDSDIYIGDLIAAVQSSIASLKSIPSPARDIFPKTFLHSSWLSASLELDHVIAFLKRYPSAIQKSELFFSRTLFGRATEPFFFHFAGKKLTFYSNQSTSSTNKRADLCLKVMGCTILIEEDKSSVKSENPDGGKIVKEMATAFKDEKQLFKRVFGILWEGTIFETYMMDSEGFHVIGQHNDVMTEAGIEKLLNFFMHVHHEISRTTKSHPDPKPDSSNPTNQQMENHSTSQSTTTNPQEQHQVQIMTPSEQVPTFVVKDWMEEGVWAVKSLAKGPWMVYKTQTARLLSDGIPREIRMLTDLQNTGKNIAPTLIEWGWIDFDEKEYWFLMPRYRQDDPTTPEQLLQYLKGVLNCLKVVHNLNMVHRDIKPLNICFNSKTCQTVLIDYNHSTWENVEEGLLVLFNIFGQGKVYDWRNNQRGDLWNLGNVIQYYLEKIVPAMQPLDQASLFLGQIQKMLTDGKKESISTTSVLDRIEAFEVSHKPNISTKINVGDKENYNPNFIGVN
jgi:hypothetical protein